MPAVEKPTLIKFDDVAKTTEPKPKKATLKTPKTTKAPAAKKPAAKKPAAKAKPKSTKK